MIRFLDIIISIISLFLFLPFFIIFLIIGWFDTGAPIYIQKRGGLNLKTFNLIKFRTMKIGTKSAATHLVNKSNITATGCFFRKFKIIGKYSNNLPKPRITSVNCRAWPNGMPKRLGTVRINPNLIPEAVRILLFGPGVTNITK